MARYFIYFSQSEHTENTGIYVASLGSKSSKRLVNSFTNAVYAKISSRGSYLLFTRGSDLIAQSFDLSKEELVGPPIRVAQRVLIETTGGFARAIITASENGTLAIALGLTPDRASWCGSTAGLAFRDTRSACRLLKSSVISRREEGYRFAR